MSEYVNFTIVSIDDNDTNNMLLEAYAENFAEQYLVDSKINFLSFSNAREGLDYIKNNDIDLLYVDFNMPELDGIQLIKEYRKVEKNTPIIMITAQGDDKTLYEEAFKEGANDFLGKPVGENLLEFYLRTKSLLELSKARNGLKELNKDLQRRVDEATEDLRLREKETLDILGSTAEMRDQETAKHVQRVALYSKLLAKEFGQDEEYQDRIFISAPFHDLGKIGIPDSVLLKKGKLTDDEYNTMKEHPKIGYDILKHSKSKYLKMGAEISLSHHERWDGNGYPQGFAGEDIPLSGRIVSIADVFDALTSVRPYKKRWEIQDAFDFLDENKGSHFDPVLVELFIKNKNEVIRIHEENKDEVDENEIETIR